MPIHDYICKYLRNTRYPLFKKDEPSVDKLKRCSFSKTKYYEIEKQITTIFPDQCLQMLEILKKVLDFDPTISTYANVKASFDKRVKRL